MKKICPLLFLVIFYACGVTKPPKEKTYQLRLLDEYIIPPKTYFDGYEIGGLSGIAFKNDSVFLVDDRSTKPIIYTAKWESSAKKIDSIVFLSSINLKETHPEFRKKSMDLESIILDEDGAFWLASEGNIKHNKKASIFNIDPQGIYLSELQLPQHWQTKGENKPRNNVVFEGITWDYRKEKIWAATELPLENDGRKPQLWNTFSPIRFTEFNLHSGVAEYQFIYDLDRVVRLPLLPFYINGVTEILSFNKYEFLVLERAFSAGRGKHSCRVKLFVANFKDTSNSLAIEQIDKKDKLQQAEKYLLLDFKQIRKKLDSKRIDNIEGMCFGPQLPNGNQTLLFVSDNNFNTFGKQINQIIWMELIE